MRVHLEEHNLLYDVVFYKRREFIGDGGVGCPSLQMFQPVGDEEFVECGIFDRFLQLVHLNMKSVGLGIDACIRSEFAGFFFCRLR